MEFHPFRPEQGRLRSVESSAASDILALALKLQSQSEELLTEDQVVEMGSELGIRPEYVRQALRLRHEALLAARTPQQEGPVRIPTPGDRLVAAVGRTSLLIFALGMLPLTLGALDRVGLQPLVLFYPLAAAVLGWAAQVPRLAQMAGALAVPLVLFVASFYIRTGPEPWYFPNVVVLSLLSMCPLCAAAGSASARLRRWLTGVVDRMTHTAPSH